MGGEMATSPPVRWSRAHPQPEHPTEALLLLLICCCCKFEPRPPRDRRRAALLDGIEVRHAWQEAPLNPNANPAPAPAPTPTPTPALTTTPVAARMSRAPGHRYRAIVIGLSATAGRAVRVHRRGSLLLPRAPAAPTSSSSRPPSPVEALARRGAGHHASKGLHHQGLALPQGLALLSPGHHALKGVHYLNSLLTRTCSWTCSV